MAAPLAPLPNRISTRVFWLLAATSSLGCGDGAPAPLAPAPVAPATLPVPGEPSDGDDSLEIPPAAPGTDEPEPMGGQSGTDSGNSEQVFCPERVPLTADRVQAGVRVSWLIADAMGRPHVFRGSFLGEPATIEVSMEQRGPARDVFGPGYSEFGVHIEDCDWVDVPLRISMSVVLAGGDTLAFQNRDGFLTLQPGRAGGVVGLYETDFSNPARVIAALNERYIPPYEYVPDECVLSRVCPFGLVDLQFDYEPAPIALHGLRASFTELRVDAISEHFLNDADWRRYSALPSSGRPEVCAAAEPTQPIDWQGPEAASSSLAGAWALCNGGSYPGIQIAPDGTWQAISPGNEPRLAAGFGREGRVTFQESLELDGEGNFPFNPPRYHFELSPSWPSSTEDGSLAINGGGDLVVSASGNTIGSDFLLVRIDPVAAPAAAPLFARGERAGAAGCASTETEIEPPAGSEQELRERLAGRWVGCSGFSGELYFDPEGNLQVLPSESHEGSSDAVTVQEPFHGFDKFSTTPFNSWSVVLARHPLKLWLKADERDAEPVILSAVP